MVHSPQAAHTHREADPAVVALIERLEDAGSGSRALDAAMAVVADRAERVIGDWRYNDQGRAREVEPFTSSIDDAVALAERCGLNVSQVLNDALESHDGIWTRGWDDSRPAGPQIARYICLAILRSLA